MTLDRQDAASSLTAIEHAEQRTGQAIIYGAASSFLILWGILTAIGYTFTEFYPYQPKIAWSVLMALGFAATAVMTMRNRGRLAGTHRQLGWQLVLAQIALIGFGLVTIMILGPVTGRQLDAFWPLLFMLGYVLAGIWVGQFFIL
jgi:hypothetical protein